MDLNADMFATIVALGKGTHFPHLSLPLSPMPLAPCSQMLFTLENYMGPFRGIGKNVQPLLWPTLVYR